MMDAQQRIGLIIVTHNRLQLLKVCVEAARRQTRPVDEIIIVDNGSTDETPGWLTAQQDLTVLRQENTGSAGGQYTGIKTAWEHGHDWIWCMDDDCRPDDDALEQLMKHSDSAPCLLNTLVVSENEPEKLSFGLWEVKSETFFDTVAMAQQRETIDCGSLFNGACIHRDVVEKIGLPIRELFIRGEEVEYYQRIRRHGFKTITVTAAALHHPPANIKMIRTSLFNHRFELIDGFKRFYRARNLVFNMRKYRNFSVKSFVKMLVLDVYGILVYQKSFSLLWQNIRGLWKGMFLKAEEEPVNSGRAGGGAG